MDQTDSQQRPCCSSAPEGVPFTLYLLAGSCHWLFFSKELLLLTETEEVKTVLDKNGDRLHAWPSKKKKKNLTQGRVLRKTVLNVCQNYWFIKNCSTPHWYCAHIPYLVILLDLLKNLYNLSHSVSCCNVCSTAKQFILSAGKIFRSHGHEANTICTIIPLCLHWQIRNLFFRTLCWVERTACFLLFF